jgi:butyryl-CoA dehydrogenase
MSGQGWSGGVQPAAAHQNFPGVPVAEAGRDAAGFLGVGVSLMALYVGVARAAQEFFVRFANDRVGR